VDFDFGTLTFRKGDVLKVIDVTDDMCWIKAGGR
jgi:hypothetical protein